MDFSTSAIKPVTVTQSNGFINVFSNMAGLSSPNLNVGVSGGVGVYNLNNGTALVEGNVFLGGTFNQPSGTGWISQAAGSCLSARNEDCNACELRNFSGGFLTAL